MPNRHRILIVDDDPEMRDALTERLSLHEEFEAREQIDGRRLHSSSGTPFQFSSLTGFNMAASSLCVVDAGELQCG